MVLTLAVCSILFGFFATPIETDFTKGREVERSYDKASAMVSYFWKDQTLVGEGMSSR